MSNKQESKPIFKWWQRTEMINQGDVASPTYGWPDHLVGKGIEVTVVIDPELKEMMPDAISNKLGHFIQDLMKWHYAKRKDIQGGFKSTSIHTTVDPWPLPDTVGGAK